MMRYKKLVVCLSGLFLVAVLAGWGTDAAEQKGSGKGETLTGISENLLVVGRMPAPKIDGRVDPSEWKAAGVITAFVDNITGGEPKAQSRAYVGYDDNNLYIAFVCAEPFMDKTLQTALPGRDQGNYNNECIEVFLNPEADRAGFLHFIIDILNQPFDALGNDYFGYNPAWESAVVKGDKSWCSDVT